MPPTTHSHSTPQGLLQDASTLMAPPQLYESETPLVKPQFIKDDFLTFAVWMNDIRKEFSKSPLGPSEPKQYKGGDYHAYFNFCCKMDLYIHYKKNHFTTELKKINYAETIKGWHLWQLAGEKGIRQHVNIYIWGFQTVSARQNCTKRKSQEFYHERQSAGQERKPLWIRSWKKQRSSWWSWVPVMKNIGLCGWLKKSLFVIQDFLDKQEDDVNPMEKPVSSKL